MGELRQIANDLAGGVLGTKKLGTNLQDFLTRFSPDDRKYVNVIDPLNTFDVQIQFYPSTASSQADSAAKSNDFKESLKAAGERIQNIAEDKWNTLTKMFDSKSSQTQTYKQAKEAFKPNGDTFVNYLLKANLLTSKDDNSGSEGQSGMTPPVLQLGYFVQNITVPQMKLAENGKSDTLLGSFTLNGHYVAPDNNQLQMSIVNTKVPLFERLFYPWMREVSLPYWSYPTQPYTTATITIDFKKHADVRYVFYGCRPGQIGTIQPTQEADGTITRDITFIFDLMTIQTDYTVGQSGMAALANLGGGAIDSLTKMFNM